MRVVGMLSTFVTMSKWAVDVDGDEEEEEWDES